VVFDSPLITGLLQFPCLTATSDLKNIRTRGQIEHNKHISKHT